MRRPHLAVFVSPHGFGHAARACAVLAAALGRWPQLEVDLFTLVPEWFFAESLHGSIRHHPLRTDVGLVQRSTLEEDPEATAAVLARWVPFDPAAVALLASLLRHRGCTVVLADISPLGLVVGHAAGLPTLLVENFTWDWIYRAYLDTVPALRPAAAALGEALSLASARVRCQPVCGEAPAELVVPPISRVPRRTRAATRRDLNVRDGRPVVLVTMGGTPWRPAAVAPLLARRDITFVIPGGADAYCETDNLVLLPHHSRFYHPDLVTAADVVIGKLGYSTVAEVYRAGTPLGFVGRERFPESPHLESFVRARMSGGAVTTAEATSSGWVHRLDALLALPRRAGGDDGAPEVAEWLGRLAGWS